MDTKHRGAHSELVASLWLIAAGYEVFRNLSQHGEVDLIYRDPGTGQLTQVDVTTGNWYVKKDGTRSLQFACGKLNKPGIRCLVVVDGECLWRE